MSVIGAEESRSIRRRLSNIHFSSHTFSWCFLGACFLLVIGVSTDAWAHNHFRLETFWTPWHAVLYSGLFATAFVLPGAMLLQRLQGVPWRETVPAGYEISVLGIIGSLIGGLGDMTWHILFGVEQNIDAAFSPTHIALMLFFGLILVGPFHALYVGKEQSSRALIVLSFALLLTYWSIITQEVSPYSHLWLVDTPKTEEQGQTLAIVTYVIQGMFLAGLTLYVLRRWKVFFGFFFIAMTISALPLAAMQNNYIVIPIGMVAGLLIDVAYYFVRPSTASIERLRLFVAAVPGIWLLTYTIIVVLVYGTVWSTHLLFGSVVVTSIVSWLLTGLMFPPAVSNEAQE